jgi:hypothetical protein
MGDSKFNSHFKIVFDSYISIIDQFIVFMIVLLPFSVDKKGELNEVNSRAPLKIKHLRVKISPFYKVIFLDTHGHAHQLPLRSLR